MPIDGVSSSGPKVFEKRVTDGHNQFLVHAPEIGTLRNNYARLNTIGKLDTKDKEDVYKFNVTNDGKLSLNLETDAQLRLQILSLNGSRVIADSNPDSGKAFDTFAAMSSGTYDMKPGTYVLKVSFAKNATPSAIDYAVQMKLGSTYPNDYITWESQESTKPEIPQPVMNPIAGIFQFFLKPLREMFGG